MALLAENPQTATGRIGTVKRKGESGNVNLKTVVKLTLLYLACFVGALLLLIHEFIVPSLLPRFVLPLFLLAAYGLTVVFVHVTFRRNRTAQSLTVPVEGPIDPATRKRRTFAIRAGETWIFSAGVCPCRRANQGEKFPTVETLAAVSMMRSHGSPCLDRSAVEKQPEVAPFATHVRAARLWPDAPPESVAISPALHRAHGHRRGLPRSPRVADQILSELPFRLRAVPARSRQC